MAETSTVTILFCDHVESTNLLTRYGDDTADELRRKLFAVLEREVHVHRGAVVKRMGDGLMAVFRSSAADAIACAIGMQRAAAAIEQPGIDAPPELRVGISAGEAAQEDGDWFGRPVVEAARLQAAARPGQILAADIVRSIVGARGGTQFRPAGARELKGFDQPVRVAEVLWRPADTPRPKPAGAPRRLRRRTPLIALAAVGVAIAITMGVVLVVRRSSGSDTSEAGAQLSVTGYQPRLEARECPPEFAAEETGVRCQDLVVPENRQAPAGRWIRLLVTVAPASAGRSGVPTLSIGGGTSDIREYGDSVALALRGERFSDPLLACPEVAAVLPRTLALPLNGPEANTLVNDAHVQCGQRLEREGVDLNAYGRDDILDDVRDLVIAMGWKQVNIDAAFNMTPTAVLLAGRYPKLVRAVFLSDPFPPGSNILDERISHFDAALRAYYAACEADDACARAFPDLGGTLSAAFERLEREPRMITTQHPFTAQDIDVQIDGDRFVLAALRGVGDTDALPFIAPALASDDDSALVAVAAFLLEHAGLKPDLPWAAWDSQYCEDTDASVSRAGVAAAEVAYPLLRAFAHDPILELCERWPTDPAADADRPELLGVPALIVTGELNPYAPPVFAEQTARSFEDAQIAVLPSLTGAAIEDGPPCIAQLRLDFLRDPTRKLDIAACIRLVPPIQFAGT